MPRYAAVDIGSNSARLMVAEVSREETRVLAQERQVTRLGESVFRSGLISAEALTFLCATLARYAEIYRRLNVVAIRAVATSAVRDAQNQDEFLTRVSATLGVPVEIISGQEEARLIYVGVESRWPRPKERTLIIDVGGGSAELIIAHAGEIVDATSRPLGAVRLKQLFLTNDPPAPADLHRLDQYIHEKLAPFAKKHEDEKFDRVIATSSSAAAIVCAANAVPRPERDRADRLRATAAQIRRLYEQISTQDLNARKRWVGIGPRRAEIIVGGTAVFRHSLEIFRQRALYYSTAGVRDGIIADLAARGAGRELTALSREQRAVVEALARRYRASIKHGRNVAHLARQLFEATQALHKLPPSAGKLLEAAAYLHDVGHFVSSMAHHKHSAYLVANSDMAGFQSQERLTIATLCRFHRKSMPQPRHSQFQSLDPESKRAVLYLIPLLRIADSLDRSHEQKIRDVHARVTEGNLVIEVKSPGDADLEIWAVGEVAFSFREVYGLNVSVQRSQPAARR